MKKHTVTVGIPAYNEEANIGNLLESLIAQKGNYKLESIIVVCDGCGDRTAKIAKQVVEDCGLGKVINSKVRKGKAARINQIHTMAKSDVLVVLDADIVIREKSFIEKIISPVTKGRAEIVSSRLIPLKPRNLVERVLYISVLIRNETSEDFRSGDNLYTCHGTSRAYSKNFYSTFRPPKIVSEDAYSYLWAKKHGYRYEYSKGAVVYYQLPGNMSDHGKQSVRFMKGKEELKACFNSNYVEEAHRLPKILLIQKTIKYFLKYPTEVVSYFGILVWMRLKSLVGPMETVMWQVAKSTRSASTDG